MPSREFLDKEKVLNFFEMVHDFLDERQEAMGDYTIDEEKLTKKGQKMGVSSEEFELDSFVEFVLRKIKRGVFNAKP